MDFSRNIGLIDQWQQEQLEEAHILIAGTGGMGGVCAEVLVRMGVGRLTLIDHDRFENTNSNRQIHCNQETIGKHKAEVLKQEFQKINPKIKIHVNTEGVHLQNCQELLSKNVNIIVNGMDDMHASLCLERTARRLKLPIVDAWITPYASVFVMKPDSPHWEEYLNLPTKNTELPQLTKELCEQSLKKEVEYTFSHGTPYEYIKKDLVEKVIRKEKPRPSLAPVVWLSGVLMANEVFKLLTKQPTTDHIGFFFDQYKNQILHRKT